MKDFDFDNIGKQMPYRVPAGFFDEAKQRAVSVCGEHAVTGRKVILRRTAAIVSAAAVLIGAAIVGIRLLDARHTAVDPEQYYASLLSEVSDDTLEELAGNYMEEISTDL